MSYTDAPGAQQQLQQFIALCREHAIPCDSFQLSSGYTTIGNKRYVFHWNHDKIPDPPALGTRLPRRGHPPGRQHQTLPAARPPALP